MSLQSAQRALTPWLAARLKVPDLAMVSWRSAGSGNSADTFFATVAGIFEGAAREIPLVIRRQNLGSDIFLDSDLSLPTRVMAAVGAHPAGAGIPVPKVIGLESDADLIGAPFMVMEQLPGRILPQSPNYNKDGWLADMSADHQARVWRGCLEMLGRIHRLSVAGHFEFLDQPQRGRSPLDQYLNWIEEWYAWARAGRPHRITDLAIKYLKANRPDDASVSLLWGDPQPTNLLFRPDGTISGVIDWEMAVLGPPEADLAWWLFFDDLFSKGMGVPRLAGLPERAVCIQWYEAALGRPVQNLDYYDVLAAFRMAIVGMRSADRQIQRGRIPATTTARENAPIVRLLAGLLGEPLPEVGADFAQLMAALGMEASLAKGETR
ncbi:MAG TPA: phosphotransferase family protein [Steroidobacteraceae bacterium]|nr:phosphotransferase family protein [Steroidobacteraceae bacterium]